MINERKWEELMLRAGLPACLSTYEQLTKSYQEKHRHYHNLSHVHAVLNHFDKSKHLSDDPCAVEIALWFHDAIYKPLSTNNELQSADWAKEFLTDNQASEAFANKVHSLIMATVHDAAPPETDHRLTVDIDLSILGSTSAKYSDFESQVRLEYRFVPSFIYKKKRSEILTSFLNRERIYSHDFFHSKFEERARQNLSNTIRLLEG